jgi:hypothetical protein
MPLLHAAAQRNCETSRSGRARRDYARGVILVILRATKTRRPQPLACFDRLPGNFATGMRAS